MIVDDFIRRYDVEGGLVHVSGLRRVHLNEESAWKMDAALCTYGEIVHLQGPVTTENVTCLRCVEWISFEVDDDE